MIDYGTKYGLGRVRQHDARNHDYPLWDEISLQDRDRALAVNKKTYWQYGLPMAFQHRLEPTIVACAYWNALKLGNVKLHKSVTVGSLHRSIRAQYMMLGGDPHEGEGSLLAGAKTLRWMRIIERYVWEYTVDGIMAWLLLGQGPMVLGCTLYAGMLQQDSRHRVRLTGPPLGGAAFAIYAADRNRGLITCRTSWRGYTMFHMYCEDVELLLRGDGEAVAFIEARSEGYRTH